ncbi:MAG: hypothetical protein P8L70_10805 [Halioglobus sp.]|nr:hypothetical protein [Halioglobus sp.]MDG2327206.1 hypothetical protein [Halioglobus sp.]
MKMCKLMRTLTAGVAIALTSLAAVSADIDLFLGDPPSAAEAPNVLFVIDNTANWSQTGASGGPIWDAEKAALATVFENLENGVVNVGFMMYTETGGSDSGNKGAYIRSAIRNMTATNKDLYADQIRNFDINDDKSNGGKAGLAMMEAYLYFAELEPYGGNQKAKTDYTLNVSSDTSGGGGAEESCPQVNEVNGEECGFKNNGSARKCWHCDPDWSPSGGTGITNSPDSTVWALPENALSSKNATNYNSPVADGFCGKNYIIFVSNGAAQDNQSDINTGEDKLSDLGGDPSQISITPSGSAKNPSDEWARFMANSDLGITTFTVDVDKVTTGQGPGWTALLKSMADVSGGTYYDVASDVTGISDAINDALSQILAVNSVFASVALPASANTQSTFLNQVFIGQFRPDEDANPRWFGNLKQYKLGFDTSGGTKVLRLQDADGETAIDSGVNGTGFLLECARSFWTPSSQDSYWSYLDTFDQRGDCLKYLGSSVSNFPDGPVVEKGGQAYVARGGAAFLTAAASARVVKTTADTVCGAGTTCTTTDFDTSNGAITASALGNSAAALTTYINWARGADTANEDLDSGGTTTDYRPSLHGDVIHSQPIAVDYASDPTDPRVVVFYGANDGMLRAINGNRATSHNGSSSGSGTVPGGEFWAFMPPDYFPEVDRTYKNTPVVKFPDSGLEEGTGETKPYGPDGPLTAAQSGSNRYLYMGMRRGGRTIYGFDVTNINSPSLVFRLGCTTPLGDNSGCASGWTDIGQTWSPMKVAYRVAAAGDPTPYLIMGGGYDACEDSDVPSTPANHSCGASTDGDKIFILNGTTGAIIKSFDTERAVPGSVTIVPVSETDLSITYAYATDAGGNVYRISAPGGAIIDTTAPASWVMTKIADLGCGTQATDTCSANRKFLFGPDVVRIPSSSSLAVMVGSGDREKPLYSYGAARSVTNYFYTLFDDPSDADWLTDENSTCGEDTMCAASLTAVDPNTPLASGVTISSKGWRMQLRPNEQVVSGALAVADTINFSTHIPGDPNDVACNVGLGTATTYNVDYNDGFGDLNNIVGGGLVPTPVAGKVVLDDGTTVPFCIGCGGEGSAIGSSEVTSGATWAQPKSRVYWKINK